MVDFSVQRISDWIVDVLDGIWVPKEALFVDLFARIIISWRNVGLIVLISVWKVGRRKMAEVNLVVGDAVLDAWIVESTKEQVGEVAIEDVCLLVRIVIAISEAVGEKVSSGVPDNIIEDGRISSTWIEVKGVWYGIVEVFNEPTF